MKEPFTMSGTYKEPKDSKYWNLTLDEKLKLLPGLISPVLAKLFSPKERESLLIDIDVREV